MVLHGRALDWVQALSPLEQRLLAIVVVLVGGYLLVRVVIALVVQAMARSKRIDDTLQGFLRGVLTTAGWVLIVVVLLAVLGVPVGGLLGGLALGGFVLGFALKDALGNLAAGVMLLLYRPFNVGEVVTVAGHDGLVTALGISLTQIKAADGRIITVPNGAVLGSAIVNHTRAPERWADVKVGISYDDDIDTAIKAVLEAVRADPRVLAEPETTVRITDLGDNAVGLHVRPWVKTADVWVAKAELHATVKRALEQAGCSIPYPQRDVHVHHVAA